MENETESIVDVESIRWLVENGGTVTEKTILAMCRVIAEYEEMYDRLGKRGCGNVECGMAESGFSDRMFKHRDVG